MPFLLPFLISHLMCCVKVYYLSWTFLSLKLKKGGVGVGVGERVSGGKEGQAEGRALRGWREAIS